ncbi:MAG: hypothetical protein ACYCVH_13860 [Ignavibacteriaceae bacterium]
MKFSIIYLEPLSGIKAKVYTVKYEGKEISEFTSFVYKFQDDHSDLLKIIIQRIQNISCRDGIQETFFRRESKKTHNVFRLLETNDLRIYCLMFSKVALLFGSGGIKIKDTTKNNQNPHLEKEIDKLIRIEDAINLKIKSGDLKITDNGLEGNLEQIDI